MARRLQWVCLLYAAGYSVSFLIPLLAVPDWYRRETFSFELSSVLLSIVVSLLVVLLLRREKSSPALVVDLGFVYQVLAAAGISCTEQWGIFGVGGLDY